MNIPNTSPDCCMLLALFKIRLLVTSLIPWAATAVGSPHYYMYVVLHILIRGISQEIEISVQWPWIGLCFCKEAVQQVYPQQTWTATPLQWTSLEGFSAGALIWSPGKFSSPWPYLPLKEGHNLADPVITTPFSFSCCSYLGISEGGPEGSAWQTPSGFW